MVCVGLPGFCLCNQGCRIDLGIWGSHGVDSFIPYNTVILRVMVSGWDSIAFGIFHASEGWVCVCSRGQGFSVRRLLCVVLHKKLHLLLQPEVYIYPQYTCARGVTATSGCLY
jgi:hypothetical protein